jgi:FixJ family two-component response regulator
MNRGSEGLALTTHHSPLTTHPISSRAAEPVVFVVDDDPSVRKALARLFKYEGFRVETFATAQEFLRQPLPDSPACLILDVRMPGLNGLDLQTHLTASNRRLPIVFITGHGNIPMTVRAMKAGAVDFLPKPFDGQQLLAIVRKAIARHAQTRLADADLAEIRQRFECLSPRERQVMALVVKGLANKQAASKLGVTEKTIKAHRARVMRKMSARSLAELVRMAEKCQASVSGELWKKY